MENGNGTIAKYDRVRGNLEGIALFSKESTISTHEPITGKAETFIVQTARHAELGDTIFVQCLDEGGVTRLALPAKVAKAIARQRESLSSRIRKREAKRVAQERKDRGELPGFMRRAAAE